MNYFKKSAFTLIELLVSITLLSILATVAFNSYVWYSSKSRDSVRTIDIQGLNKSLRLSSAYAWIYPTPSNPELITYVDYTVWTQGTIWESVIINFEEINNIPIDPLTWNEYSYSVLNSWKEYELSSILENGSYSYNNISETANAWTDDAMAYVIWNFNWIFTQIRIWTTDYIISTPSIITSNIDTMENIIANSSFVFDWLKNLPASYTWSYFDLEWSSNLTFLNTDLYDPVIYLWCISELRQGLDYDTNRWIILKLQELYSWTDIANNKKIKNLLDIDTSTWSLELATYMELMFNKLAASPWCGDAIYYCDTTPTYIHAAYFPWISTSTLQPWQDDISWDACYYHCIDDYSSSNSPGDCSIEPVEEWVCWNDHTSNKESTPIDLCSGWEVEGLDDNWVWSTYDWYCKWLGWEDNSPGCWANHILNWLCWVADEATYVDEPPVADLCDAWTGTTVTVIDDNGVSKWTWDCEWSSLGTVDPCWAYDVDPINWSCWPADTWEYSDTPPAADLCSVWNSDNLQDEWVNLLWTWDCLWVNWWNPANCTADHVPDPIDWFCWNDHKKDKIDEPTLLCDEWTSSLVDDEGLNLDWTWTCSWTDWWNPVDCYANHVEETIGLQLTYSGMVTWDVIELPFNGSINIHKIDWDDSWTNWCATTADFWVSCTYTGTTLDSYTIKIYWLSSGFGSSSTTGIEKLVSIDKWDELWITNLAYIWAWAINLTSVPSYLPVWVTNLKHMFNDADSFNQDIASFATWTVDVTDMDYMFSETEIFNQDISSWQLDPNVSYLKFDFNNNASWDEAFKPIWP